MNARAAASAARARRLWYGLVGAGGLAFGSLGDRHPFGGDVLAHPLVVFFAVIGAALLALRLIMRRPVPDLIPERDLLIGCAVGATAYLVANWVAAILTAAR